MESINFVGKCIKRHSCCIYGECWLKLVNDASVFWSYCNIWRYCWWCVRDSALGHLSATHFALSAALSVLTIPVGIYCYTLWPFLFLKLLKILNNIMFTYFIYFSLFWSSLFWLLSFGLLVLVNGRKETAARKCWKVSPLLVCLAWRFTVVVMELASIVWPGELLFCKDTGTR